MHRAVHVQSRPAIRASAGVRVEVDAPLRMLKVVPPSPLCFVTTITRSGIGLVAGMQPIDGLAMLLPRCHPLRLGHTDEDAHSGIGIGTFTICLRTSTAVGQKIAPVKVVVFLIIAGTILQMVSYRERQVFSIGESIVCQALDIDPPIIQQHIERHDPLGQQHGQAHMEHQRKETSQQWSARRQVNGGQHVPLGLGNFAGQKVIEGQELWQCSWCSRTTVSEHRRQHVPPGPRIVFQGIFAQGRSDGVLVRQTGRAETRAQRRREDGDRHKTDELGNGDGSGQQHGAYGW